MVLHKKKRIDQWTKEPINKPTHIQPVDIWHES
jgi:hypothetical protein